MNKHLLTVAIVAGGLLLGVAISGYRAVSATA